MDVTKVSSWLTDKNSQPPVYQVGLGQRAYILPGALWATLGHLPPIPQHPRTPGHKAFMSQLTANEPGGIRFAGVGPKWSTVLPRSARANPLWQPRALGIWGRYLPIEIPHLSGTPDAHWSGLNWCHPQGHHARRPPTTVPGNIMRNAGIGYRMNNNDWVIFMLSDITSLCGMPSWIWLDTHIRHLYDNRRFNRPSTAFVICVAQFI